MASLSRRTLGYTRDILTGLEPDDLYTPSETRDFWKPTLFDAGFPSNFIEIAASYNFKWSDIILDLESGKFAPRNRTTFVERVLPATGTRLLGLLVSYAAAVSGETSAGIQLLESIDEDGVSFGPSVDSDVPIALAKLPNKESLLSDLTTLIDDREITSVLFIDLDHFKVVNDQHGHGEGDKCLVEVVGAIRTAIAGKGKLYRVGGDEFAVLLPNFSILEASATAERARANVDALKPFGGTTKVTISIGVASTNCAGLKRSESIVQEADDAMYVSKWLTRNRVTTWPPSDRDRKAADENRVSAGKDKKA